MIFNREQLVDILDRIKTEIRRSPEFGLEWIVEEEDLPEEIDIELHDESYYS